MNLIRFDILTKNLITMKTTAIFFLIIATILNVGVVKSQISINAEAASLSNPDRALIEQRVSRHSAFTVDKKEIAARLNDNGGFGQIRLRINENKDWIIDLEVNDLRAPSFKQEYVTEKGTFVYDQFILNTFRGRTSNNQVVRFTIDDNNFFGVIFNKRDYYIIKSARDYTGNFEDETFIIFNSSDVIISEHFEFFEDLRVIEYDINELIMQNEEHCLDNILLANLACRVLLIATDADYEFFQQTRGASNLPTNTNNFILSQLNIVDGLFESALNLRINVTSQRVFTSSNTPYNSTNANTLLGQFRTEWINNRRNIRRNIAHLFTGKNLEGNIAGVAFWPGQISNPNAPVTGSNHRAFSLSRNWSRMYRIVAHEIGHNLNANHPASIDCLCDMSFHSSIMCPFLSGAPNMWFCDESICEINSFLNNNAHLLGCIYIYGPHTICGNTPRQFFVDNLPAEATSVSWSGIHLTCADGNCTTPIANGRSSITMTRRIDRTAYLEATVNFANGTAITLRRQVTAGRPVWSSISSTHHNVAPGFCPGNTLDERIKYQGEELFFGNPYHITNAEWFPSQGMLLPPELSHIVFGTTLSHDFAGPFRRAVTINSFRDNFLAHAAVRLQNQCGWSDFRILYYFKRDNCGGFGNLPCGCPPSNCTCLLPPIIVTSITHPNPADDILTIDLTQRKTEAFEARTDTSAPLSDRVRTSEVFNIRLLNAQGMIVRQQRTQANSIQFDVSNLPEGTYYLHIEHNGEIERHQIFVQRN